jgi:hypothetical protein
MIIYLTGDATRPQYGSGDRLIPHICNMEGKWGRGFVVSLSQRWKTPEACYREWHRTGNDSIGGKFHLGRIQPVKVENRTFVVNMLAQKFIGRPGPYDAQNEIPLSYDALALCLSKVRAYAKEKHDLESMPNNHVTIHAPKFGSGLAGGDWTKIERLINGTIAKEFSVYIYTPEKAHG